MPAYQDVMQVRARTVAEDSSLSDIGSIPVINDNNLRNKNDEHSYMREISESGVSGIARDYIGSLVTHAGRSMITPSLSQFIA